MDAIKSKLLWVHRKLAIKEQLSPKVREPEFVTGERFGYLGRSYRLAITSRQEKPRLFDGHGCYLRADARSSAPGHFRLWYISVGKPWIERRAEILAARTGAAPSRIEVGDLGYRWGSCGKHRAVYFNFLFQLDVASASRPLG